MERTSSKLGRCCVQCLVSRVPLWLWFPLHGLWFSEILSMAYSIQISSPWHTRSPFHNFFQPHACLVISNNAWSSTNPIVVGGFWCGFSSVTNYEFWWWVVWEWWLGGWDFFVDVGGWWVYGILLWAWTK